MCSLPPSSQVYVTDFVESLESNGGTISLGNDSLLSPLLDKCKRLSETVRVQRATQRRVPPSLINVTLDMPSRTICDELVQLYFRTFDTVFRVLHVPTFQRECEAYWRNDLVSKETFHQKLLLVMAIGTCFYYETEEHECSLRSLASRWIFQVQYWLVNVFETGEPNMDVIQVSALLLLARQIDRVGTNLIWISADFPLRIAISEGYHKEPSIHFPDIPPFEAEMRRRVWATILELSLQSSLDAGMPAPISCDGFDCGPPANVDDTELDAMMNLRTAKNPSERFTQSTAQIMLVHTVRLRLKILQSLTTFENPLSYQDTLRLGLEVEAMCRPHLALIQSCLSVPSTAGIGLPTQFQIKLLDNLTRRFVLALHEPFATLAKTDLSYYYSKKVVSESAFQILSYPPPPFRQFPVPVENDDYSRLQIFGGGIFRQTSWHALACLITELSDDVNQSSFITSVQSSRVYLYEAVQKQIDVLRRQKKAGDLDTEAFMLFSCAAARISAQFEGNLSPVSITETARSSLDFCCSVLEAEVGVSVRD
jgi:hypothetical protein